MKSSSPNPRILAALAAALVLAACGTSAPTPVPQPSETTAPPASTPVVAPTESSGAPADVSLDTAGVAQQATVETIPAQPASADAPYWSAGPEYRLLTLQGYPVTNHLIKPQIFVYPVADMASTNEGMATIAADLQALLQTRQPGEHLPFLPLYNAAQVMHAQLEYLDFTNGSGIRYLTQFDQAPLPVNNYELLYTFQGLTSDGRYYVAAVMPVTNPELPADASVDESLLNDFQAYLGQTVALLDQQPAGSFTPDLSALDALVRSIEVH